MVTFELHQLLMRTPRTSGEAARILGLKRRQIDRALQHLIEQGSVARVGNVPGGFQYGAPRRKTRSSQ